MVILTTTFTGSEIEEFLVEDGYKPGTKAFNDERARRYFPVEGGVFIERDDWDGVRRKAGQKN